MNNKVIKTKKYILTCNIKKKVQFHVHNTIVKDTRAMHQSRVLSCEKSVSTCVFRRSPRIWRKFKTFKFQICLCWVSTQTTFDATNLLQ